MPSSPPSSPPPPVPAPPSPSPRLPPRRPRSSQDRTRDRVLAVAGVVALLAVFVAIVSMIGSAGGGSSGDDQAAAVATAQAERTPTATPTPTPTPKPTPAPLSAAEREERQAAADVVASRGFQVTRLRDWDPDDTLRVLIGRSSTGGRLAFFFVNGDYIGNDSTETSARLTVRHTGDLVATLRYGTFVAGDAPDAPTGDPVDVRFHWDGTRLAPETALPAPEQRTAGRQVG